MTKHEQDLLEIIKKLQKRVDELEARPVHTPQPRYIPNEPITAPQEYYYRPFITGPDFTSAGTQLSTFNENAYLSDLTTLAGRTQ